MKKSRNIFNHWLQQTWYEGASPPVLLRPLSCIFQFAVRLRRAWYEANPKAVRHLPVPVIVVGNLTVGGTGKTPLVIWLAQFLAQSGYRPGIVSRGYGVKLQQPQLVTSCSDPAQAGDEPVLIARKTGCPVCIFPDRVRAAEVLLASSGCDVIISDDGLQHYRMGRDIEIAVIDGDRRFGNAMCLPGGPLREPLDRLSGVDLLVCNGGDAQPDEYLMQVQGALAVNLADETLIRPLALFQGENLLAVAAIGNPMRFFKALRKAGLAFVEKALPDHHAYTAADVASDEGVMVLMTEKDAVKCKKFATDKLWYVPVKAELPARFGEKILNLLNEK